MSSSQLGHAVGGSRTSSTRKRGTGGFRKGSDLRSFVEEHLHLPDHVLHKLQQHQQQLQQQQQQHEGHERGIVERGIEQFLDKYTSYDNF